MKNEYYEYCGNTYKVIDHAQHKDSVTREWVTTVLYTDGKLMFTREVDDFYEWFNPLRKDSVEVATFEFRRFKV